MKVVINKCYGGFSLSREAVEHMAAAGHEWAKKEIAEHEETLAAFEHYKAHKTPMPGRPESEPRFFDINLKYGSKPSFYGHYPTYEEGNERHSALLVAAVEALGDRANGEHARLCVIEIPDGVDYEISEYDGNEHIAEKHRTWP